MSFKQAGNKRDNVIIVVKNAESSATLTAKTPVCFYMNGTDDGLAVVKPSTGGVPAAHAAFAGCLLESIAVGKCGESMIYGFVEDAVLLRMVRANTSGGSSWTSSDSIAKFTPLNVDTVNDCFSSFATVVAATGYLPFAFLAEDVTSQAASATNATDTRTAITVAANIFVRSM
jgi:hypothetical protein